MPDFTCVFTLVAYPHPNVFCIRIHSPHGFYIVLLLGLLHLDPTAYDPVVGISGTALKVSLKVMYVMTDSSYYKIRWNGFNV